MQDRQTTWLSLLKMWGGSWDSLASVWKLCNFSSYKMLHFWLNHDYSWGGCVRQEIGRTAKVCLPCSPMLLTLLLMTTQLLGVFAHSNRGRSCLHPFCWNSLTIRFPTTQAGSLSPGWELSLWTPFCSFLIKVWAMGH